MRSRGFSMVEMILVMTVISILLAIATLSFKEYARRYKTEAQTRLLFAELLKARVNAICQRRTTRVKLFPSRYEVYSSQQDGAGVKPLQTHILSYPITCNAKSGDPVQGYPIDFQQQGMAINECSICLDPSAGSGAVDSIKVSATRVSIGKKKDQADACDNDNISFK